MKKRNTLSLGVLSSCRNTVYTFSALWICLFHAVPELTSPWLLPVKLLRGAAGFGADIFVLMSGISLYNSLSKNKSVLRFYLRRLRRILPPYLLVSLPFFFLMDIIDGQKGAAYFLSDLTGISLFTRGCRISWFVTAILIMYLIYPLLHRLYEKTKYNPLIPLLLIAAAILLNILLYRFFPEFWSRCDIFFRRFPVFYAGAYLGKSVKEGYTPPFNKTTVIIIAAAGIILAALKEGKILPDFSVPTEYIYSLFSVPVALSFTFADRIKQVRIISALIAPATLEIYLLHEKIAGFLSNYMDISHSIIFNTSAFALTIIIAVIMNKIIITHHYRDSSAIA